MYYNSGHLPVNIAVVKDVGMMVSRVKANQAEEQTAEQYHYQPQLEGDEDLWREQTHRQRQHKRHQVAKFKDSVFLEYRIVPRKD